jgi:UDP-N-acetylmuramoyl-L-alanyl-D-glutamate--2,6-diaminopimelate ligase
MKLAELLLNVDTVNIKADLQTEIDSLSCDTRQPLDGSLFACVPGTRFDGHSFAAEAAQKGARVLLVEREGTYPLPFVQVGNVRRALSGIAANFYGRPADKLRLIGVTGTNGKTTTTALIKHLLEADGHKVGLIGTIANMIGDMTIPAQYTTPDAIALHALFAEMAERGVDIAVMEVSSHALDQSRVADCHFEIAVFTNLSQDHLDYHADFAHYIAAKKKLFFQSDIGLFNLDDSHSGQMMADVPCQVLTYSAASDLGDAVAKNIQLKSRGVRFEFLYRQRIGRAKFNTPGMFSVYNALGALLAAVTAGVAADKALEAIQSARGVKGRAEVVDTGDRPYTVMIDYAHTPDGLENILSAVREFAAGRVVVLFGCGGDRDPLKRPIMAEVAARLADFLIITSDNPRSEDPAAIIQDILPGLADTKTPYTVIENRRQAIAYALDHAVEDDVIILAGKGHETYQILQTGKIHFDEREIISDHLRETSRMRNQELPAEPPRESGAG